MYKNTTAQHTVKGLDTMGVQIMHNVGVLNGSEGADQEPHQYPKPMNSDQGVSIHKNNL